MSLECVPLLLAPFLRLHGLGPKTDRKRPFVMTQKARQEVHRDAPPNLIGLPLVVRFLSISLATNQLFLVNAVKKRGG